MMPNDELSTEPVYSPFLYPDNMVADTLTDYEMGGISIDDPSEGLLYQPWVFWTNEGSGIFCKPLDTGAPTLLVGANGITSVSGTFSRNMRPTVAYVIDGMGYLHWFDTVVNNMVTTEFPGIGEIRVAHDDKRKTASSRSDVIVAYTRGGNLYYRQQRDRYTIERLLKTGVVGELRNMGMNTGLRLQFELG